MMLHEIEPIRQRERLLFFDDVMAATSAQITLQQTRQHQNRLRGDISRPATPDDLESVGIKVIHA